MRAPAVDDGFLSNEAVPAVTQYKGLTVLGQYQPIPLHSERRGAGGKEKNAHLERFFWKPTKRNVGQIFSLDSGSKMLRGEEKGEKERDCIRLFPPPLLLSPFAAAAAALAEVCRERSVRRQCPGVDIPFELLDSAGELIRKRKKKSQHSLYFCEERQKLGAKAFTSSSVP